MYERVCFIDIAKGLGIFWVVWAHIAHIELIWEYVWPFHMPLFFFISGLLFSQQYDFKTFFKKRVRSLLVPYAVFFSITFLYWVFIERYYRGGQYSIGYELVGLVYGTYEGGHLFFNGVLWFLPCLFATGMVFYPISKLANPVGVFGGIILSFTIGQYLLKQHVFWLPFGLHTAFNAVLFYGMGFLMKDMISKMRELPKWQITMLLVSCLLFQLLFMGHYVSNIKVCTLPYAAISFGGILFYMMLSILIRRNGVLEFLGRQSLVILCLHAPVCRALIYGVSTLCSVPIETIRTSYLFSLAVSILAIVTILPFMFVWKGVMERI